MFLAYGFVDGAYLRMLAKEAQKTLVDPRRMVNHVVNLAEVQSWAASRRDGGDIRLARVHYYDGLPEVTNQHLQEYWEAIELLPDTELGFGSVRRGTTRKGARQKGVDTLIAVDMLAGAFDRLFSVAVLLSGDADFVPVVHEVRRRGVMVVVAAAEKGSKDLRRAADRFVLLDPQSTFPPLRHGDREWSASEGSPVSAES